MIPPGTIPGTSNDADIAALYHFIVQEAPPRALLIELGVWSGVSLAAMAESARQFGRDDLRIVGVDLWLGSAGEPDLIAEARQRDVLGECIARLRSAGVLDRVALLRCDSIRAAALFPDGSVHFVFHDSCHLEEFVRREIAAWHPRIKSGGLQAGHDISRPGVASAVRAFFGNQVHQEGSCWWVEHV